METGKLTYEQVLAMFAKTDAQMAKTDIKMAEMAAQFAKTEAQVAKMSAKIDKIGDYINNVNSKVEGISDTLGLFAEAQVKPRLIQMFRKRGIDMREIHPNVEVSDKGVFLFEIDLLLVNTAYTVAVEVKNTLRQKDVDEHLKRIAKLRAHPIKSVRGTKLFGAVAGMSVKAEVATYAMKKGFFVIVPSGEGVEIGNPPGFEAKTWEMGMGGGY